MSQVRVYVCRDEMEAHFLRALLEGEGIGVTILGEALGQVAGGVPVAYAMPEIWVSEADVGRATALLEDVQKGRRMRGGGGGGADEEWVCPGCGERIEGQFTDCWKCQTPRPPGGGDEGETAAPAEEPVLSADIRCGGCSYNLRGLPALHRCPECGRAIFPSLVAAWPSAEEAEWRTIRDAMRYVAGQLGCPAEAVLFLFWAYARMAEEVGLDLSGDDGGGLGAVDVRWFCSALGWYAVRQFGTAEHAAEALRGWGIAGSRDVGRVLAVMRGGGPPWDVVAGPFAEGAEVPVREWFGARPGGG